MKFCVFFAALTFSLTSSFSTFAQSSNDAVFLAARDALRNGDLNRLEAASANIGNHPLAPLVESYRLRSLLARNDTAGIPQFLQRYDGSYVAEKMRADWIRWLAKRSTWNLIETEYAKLRAPEPEITCYQQQARWARGERNVLDEADGLWLSMLEPAEGCRPLFDTLVITQRVDSEAVYARARLQLEINRPIRARQTLDYLPEGKAIDAKSFDNAVKNGMAYLARQPANWYVTRSGRELTAIALRYVAANDPAIAARELENRQPQMQASEAQWAWSQIALQAARKHMAETMRWYAKAGNTPLSEENHQWKVRSALRALAWGEVKNGIEAMPTELAARPEWVYWLGRAYKAGGRSSDADALFARIAGQAHFYGNLADEELGRSIQAPAKAAAPTPEENRAARENPGMQRALALFRLDMRTEAVREWNWALRGMSDRELLAAAHLARQNQIWDRAINTADRTRNEHDYSLRFLAPYDDQIRPVAREQAIDDAWVYGLMRQESRFITSAKSTVGASGLMQLMPATAKWVAKKIGLNDFHHGKVNDTEVNVLLGTSYMRIVMENLDNHPVLASAAYNAGPGRAKRWRAEQALEGAIYAESIPFSETRDYVKKVMSNAVYYSVMFNGKPDSLKARLGTVLPGTSKAMKDRDLP
jgi:soluble lytic murein transglycosylase